MTALTERYIYAAARSVPERQRTEFERELRERIGDAIDAIVEQGTQPDEAERIALTELGDPAVLAAAYVDRPLQLLGPRYYLVWWRLVKLLLAIVLPIAAAVIAITQLAAGAPVGGIIGTTIAISLTTGVHIVFWTTLVFVVLDRMPAPEGARGIDEPWTVDRLPQLPNPERPHRTSDFVASLVFLAIFAGAIVWQQFFSVFRTSDGAPIPLLDPALWSFWLPYALGIILLEALFAIWLYRTGWNWANATVNVLLNAAFAVPAVWLVLEDRLFNPAYLEAFGDAANWTDSAANITMLVIAGVIAIVALWDAVDGIVKAARGGGRATLSLSMPGI